MSSPPPAPQDTVIRALGRAVAAAPERIFLDFQGETYTYAQVERLSTELAFGLLQLGVQPGQAVATVLDNNIDAITVWLAINKINAVSAPVNTAFKGEFLRAQLDDCHAQVVIAEAEYAPRVAEVAEGLPHLRHLFTRGGEPPRLGAGVSSWLLDDLRASREGVIQDTTTPDQLSLLIYTSGTTGPAKGCMLPHNLACNMGWRLMRNRSYGPDDVIWTPLPMFHLNAIAATVMAAMIAQCRVSIAPRFSVSGFWPEIERSGAGIVNILGSMASMLANAPDHPAAERCFGQLRLVNAAPFPPQAMETWKRRFGAQSASSGIYGMTEAATICSLAPGEEGPAGSSGRVGYDFDVKIIDDQSNELPAGTPGDIVCRPRLPNVMFQGYWNRSADTVKVWRDLWFRTGDIGKVDEEGYFYFLDRKKDYIRRRGENISTMQMEAIFRQHPAIQDVAVHAVLSPMGEDEVKVTAEVVPDAKLTEEDLCRWSIDRVPYFAVPLYVEFRETLPRNAMGKVLKEQLRSEGKTERTWDREAAGVTFQRR